MRSLAALVLLLVGALLVPLATAGWWLREYVVPADAYVHTVAPLSNDENVQDAVADNIVAEVMAGVDEEGIVDRVTAALEAGGLPPEVTDQLQGRSGRLERRIEELVRRATQVVVASPAFDSAWRSANRAVHRQLTAVLAGDSDAVRLRAGDQVVLRLETLSRPVQDAMADAGVPFAAAVPPVQGSYTVGDVDDLQRAQAGYTALDRWGRLLPVAAAVLVALGLALAINRRRALFGTALVALLGMAALAGAVVLARARYLDHLPAGLPRPAAAAYYDVLVADLWRNIGWVAGGTLVVLVLAAVVQPRSHRL